MRTSKKKFIRQLAQIERREARIRRIRHKLRQGKKPADDQIDNNPVIHHHIGVSQNEFIEIGQFLRSNSGDPAINVCYQTPQIY